MPLNTRTLYRCFAGDGQLLYVGATMSGAQRLAQHASKNWWPDVQCVELEHFPTMEEATTAEAEAIANESPVHNRNQGSVVTEEEIARRRQRRDEITVERRRERQKQAEFLADSYPVSVVCINCGHGSDSKWLWFRKGTSVGQTKCRKCGLAAYERKAA